MNCPICNQALKTRYEIAEFTASCNEMVRKFVQGKHYYSVIEKSHFSISVTHLNNVLVEKTSFIINNWIFDVADNQTRIFSLDNILLLALPWDLQPQTVDVEKIKALLLFS